MKNDTAMVLFSGGQDSATCLAWALDRFQHVETVGFDYGQRHRIELDVRPNVLAAIRAGFPAGLGHWAKTMSSIFQFWAGVDETALTRDVGIAIAADGLPNTFVPGRNLIFLSFAAALAYRRGARHIVTGVCETDYSGYPDCRDDTVKAMQLALNLGMDTRFVIHTPLMWIDKAATWRLAERLGGDDFVRLVNEETHSCYEGRRDLSHDWGRGCGTCPACALRALGWSRYRDGEAG